MQVGEVQFDADTSYSLSIPENWGGLLIVLEGQIQIQGETLKQTAAVAFRAFKADQTLMLKSDGEARIAVIQGLALNQPIYQKGPMMLADEAQLADRISAYQCGEFGVINSSNTI
jgi:redox-sensitive bicupin YhaK (pirin superfamily)